MWCYTSVWIFKICGLRLSVNGVEDEEEEKVEEEEEEEENEEEKEVGQNVEIIFLDIPICTCCILAILNYIRHLDINKRIINFKLNGFQWG